MWHHKIWIRMTWFRENLMLKWRKIKHTHQTQVKHGNNETTTAMTAIITITSFFVCDRSVPHILSGGPVVRTRWSTWSTCPSPTGWPRSTCRWISSSTCRVSRKATTPCRSCLAEMAWNGGMGVSQNGWFIGENPIENGWFRDTPMHGNHHITWMEFWNSSNCEWL